MRLDRFDPADATRVAAWARSVDEAMRWCSHNGHPVPASTIAAWADEPGCLAFGLRHGQLLVGYGELWVEDDRSEVELARLIIDPDHRGRGLGRFLVEGLVDLARSHTAGGIYLRVRPDNDGARRVYERVGFTRVAPEREGEWNAGQPVPYVWMEAPPAP